MKRKNHLLFKLSALFLFSLLLFSCEKDDTDTTPPGQVTDLVAVAGNQEVVLSWTEPDDADLDRIEITYTPGSDILLSQAAGMDGHTVANLANGTMYTFSVVTVDLDGNKSQAAVITAMPNTPFVVTHPNQDNYNAWGGGTFTTDEGGHVIIAVTFNRAVDIASVKPTYTIYFEGNAISQGTVAFTNENKTVTFTTTGQVTDFATFSPDAHFDFMLIGDDAGDGVIMDSNGMVLDGDEDGESGGDYVLSLYIIG